MGTACALTVNSDFTEKRRRYHECLDANDQARDSCEHLRVRAETEYKEYEQEARRNWGCERSPDGCGPSDSAMDRREHR